MLKAKALCAVNGNLAPEIRPLMSVGEAPLPAVDTHGNGLRDLIGGMQNIVIESVGSDEKIPEAAGNQNEYLRSRGLISEIEGLLHTEDLFYVRQTLQNLYDLDEAGNRTWYSLPERLMVTDMGRSA